MPIYFFNEQIDFHLPKPDAVCVWLQEVITQERHTLDTINYIFCNDTSLHRINKKHLQHDTLTDIITFDYRTEERILLADIYISIERVKANAIIFQVSFAQELARVLVHGILHLVGYHDTTPVFKAQMRSKEDFYLLSAKLETWSC